MKTSKNSDIINVELLRICAAKFIDPDNFQEKFEDFDIIANFFRKRFYYVIYFSLLITAIPSIFIIYYSTPISNGIFFAIKMSVLHIFIYAIPYFLLNFYIQWHLSFSNSFLSRRIYKFEIPERLTVFFNLLKTEQIRVYPQWMKPRTNQSALRAIFGKRGVTLEPALTGEAFSSRLLPLLLSSRKSDWGFCAIKGYRSLGKGPLYVPLEPAALSKSPNLSGYALQNSTAGSPSAAALPVQRHEHWRHDIHPEFREIFCEKLFEYLEWTGTKAAIGKIGIMGILTHTEYVKNQGKRENVTVLVTTATKEIERQIFPKKINDVWPRNEKNPDFNLVMRQILGFGETGVPYARVRAVQDTLRLQAQRQ